MKHTLEPLEPELRELLDAARRRDAEDPADDPGASLCLARVEAAVRGPVAGVGRMSSRRYYRVGVIVAAFATVATSLVMVEQDESTRPSGVAPPTIAPMAAASAAGSRVASEESAADDRTIPTLRIDDLPSARMAAPRPPAQPTASHAAAAPRVVSPSKPSEPSRGQLADELRLIERARTALGAKDPEAALSAVRDHERHHPAGQLVQERERIYVQALAETGHADEARARRDAFRERFPSGLLRLSVERAAASASAP